MVAMRRKERIVQKGGVLQRLKKQTVKVVVLWYWRVVGGVMRKGPSTDRVSPPSEPITGASYPFSAQTWLMNRVQGPE